MTGIEPVTSSLPRKHSTPELHRLFSFILNFYFYNFKVYPSGIIQNLKFIIQNKDLWGEKDSNLRRFLNGFTVRPRWPLEYLP